MEIKVRVIVLLFIISLLSITLAQADFPQPQAPVTDVEVLVHPTVKTVLVVKWMQGMAVEGGWIEFSIDGGPWKASPEREIGAGQQQELVLGAPADTLVTVRIMNRIAGTPVSSIDTWTTMTGSLPAHLEEPKLSIYNPEK